MIDALYECPACPVDCTGSDNEFITNECTDAIELLESEICTMIYTRAEDDDPEVPFVQPVNWEATADWEAAIDAGSMFKVNVIGDIPEPTDNLQTLSKRRTKFGKKDFTANIDIDEWTVANYNAMRNWECGATIFVWFQTVDGILIGGQTGIRVDITKANSPFLRGENNYLSILLGMAWKSNCHPPVTDAVDQL